MPADAISGLAELIAALIQALIEGLILAIELVVELTFLAVEAILFLVGKARRLQRPGWVIRRRTAGDRIKSFIVAVLFLSAVTYVTFQYFGYTRLSFSSNGFIRPDGVEVMLIRDEKTQVALIQEGKLKLPRGRWDRLVVRDPRYRASDFAISGRRMDLRLEKIQTPRDAATDAVIDKAAELLRKKFDRGEEADEKE